MTGYVVLCMWAAATHRPVLCIMKPCNGQPATVVNCVMAGVAADSRNLVDRIYKTAIELGGFHEGPLVYAPKLPLAQIRLE